MALVQTNYKCKTLVLKFGLTWFDFKIGMELALNSPSIKKDVEVLGFGYDLKFGSRNHKSWWIVMEMEDQKRW